MPEGPNKLPELLLWGSSKGVSKSQLRDNCLICRCVQFVYVYVYVYVCVYVYVYVCRYNKCFFGRSPRTLDTISVWQHVMHSPSPDELCLQVEKIPISQWYISMEVAWAAKSKITQCIGTIPFTLTQPARPLHEIMAQLCYIKLEA